MKKIIGLMAVIAMVGLLAGPAAADNTAPTDAGVIQGTANVGKTRTSTCNNDGGGNVGGGGLGAPLVTTPKTGYWQLVSSGGVTSANGGTGDLSVCGELAPVAGVGAACGVSNGHSGKGKVSLNTGTVYLNDVNWVTSAGGALPVTGEASTTAKKENASTLVAVVYATGGANCANKRDAVPAPAGTGPKGDGSGATTFTVVGAYAIV